MLYKNIGLTRLLSTAATTYQQGPGFTYARYGVAFAQMAESACFGIAAAGELWLRFGLFRGGADVARVGDNTSGFTGVQFGGSFQYYQCILYVDGATVQTINNLPWPMAAPTFDFLLHIKAGASDGVLDFLAVDGNGDTVETYAYTGPVNSGADFANVYAYSENPGNFFYDVVVSDTVLTVNDHAGYSETLNGDTMRTLTASGGEAVTLHADTRRALYITIKGDTSRRVGNRVQIAANTKRRIPREIKTDFSGPPYPSDGITAINLNLAEATLTDTASYGTVIPTLPKEELQGYILDFPYSFIVESTSHSGLEMTAKCTYDVDRLLYTPFKLQSRNSVNSQTFAAEVAAALGKGLIYHGDTFTYKNKTGGNNSTYKSLVSSVFGWSNRVPRIQYNVAIRGGNLLIIQRGAETGLVNLDEIGPTWIESMPTITRELVRTIWSYGVDSEIDGGIGAHQRVFVDGGDDEYNNEVVTYDHLTTPAGETDSRPRTIYRYNSDGSYTLIEYSYQWTGSNYVLRSETETTRAADGSFISQSITYHEILQGGWRNSYTTAVDEQGNTIGVGSTGGRTRPGDMATGAYADQVKLARGGKWVGTKNGIDGGTSLVDTDFPVDNAMQTKCLNEIKALNQSIKETVTLSFCPPVAASVPAYLHVVDFTDRIIWQGHEYYLSSNSVSFTPTGHRQTLTLVRWII